MPIASGDEVLRYAQDDRAWTLYSPGAARGGGDVMDGTSKTAGSASGVVFALGEKAIFKPGDWVRVSTRSPIGHYRVPTYLRGKSGSVERVIEPAAIDNEEEGYGRNAGSKRHYYRVAFRMSDIWPDYAGSERDGLHIEVFETWLERAER